MEFENKFLDLIKLKYKIYIKSILIIFCNELIILKYIIFIYDMIYYIIYDCIFWILSQKNVFNNMVYYILIKVLFLVCFIVS